MPRRVRGFTLVELLVVIGIITVTANLICPSDLIEAHGDAWQWGPYPFSYVMNWSLACDAYPQFRITHVKRSSEKIMLGEEDFSTINDGQWCLGALWLNAWSSGPD